MNGTYGDPVPTGSIPDYTLGMPAAVVDPNNHIRTAGSTPGMNRGDWPEASANFDYVSPAEGGQAGSVMRNGWSTGIAKLDRNVHHFTGRAVTFVRRNLQGDTGPVGTDNHAGVLAAGVQSQVQQYPSLQDIALSLTGGNR
jgi:hypothetical protein